MAWLVGPARAGWQSPASFNMQLSCCCAILQAAAQARQAHDEHQRLERVHQHCLLAQYRERRECEADQAALEAAKQAALQAEQAGLIPPTIISMQSFVALWESVTMSHLRLHCRHMAVDGGVHLAIS